MKKKKISTLECHEDTSETIDDFCTVWTIGGVLVEGFADDMLDGDGDLGGNQRAQLLVDHLENDLGDGQRLARRL